MTLITHKHMRSMGYCNRGGRLFCKRHGLDWDTLRKQGIDSKELEKIIGNDAQVKKLEQYVKSLKEPDNESSIMDMNKDK